MSRNRKLFGSMVLALLAVSLLAFTASASTTGPNTGCSAATPFASLAGTAIGKQVFSPAKLSVKRSAAGALVCIANKTAAPVALANNGHAMGILAADQARTFQITASEANGSSVISLMPARAAGPSLTISFRGATVHPGVALSSCSAATQWASLSYTAVGTQAFSPAKLSVKRSAAGAIVCIKNSTAAPVAPANSGHAMGILASNEAKAFQIQATEANGSSVISLMPARAAGPTLTISFRGATVHPGVAPAAACSAATPSASLSATASGKLVFSPSHVTVAKSLAGGAVCIRNSSSSMQTVAYKGQAIGSLQPGESRVFIVSQAEANGTAVLSLWTAAGPSLTLNFK